MHVVHIGTSQYLLGSVLFKLVYQMLPGRPLENMEVLWQEICGEYRSQEVAAQFSSLGLSSFLVDVKAPTTAYPRLKGRAAEIKWLVPVLQAIWERRKRPGNQIDQLVSIVLQEQLTFQALIDEDADMFQMEAESAKQLPKTVDRLLATYARLAFEANQQGELLWSMVPKHHMLWHFARKAWCLHPRRGACYSDEDFMGVVKRLVQGCTSATELHKVASTVLKKYRWGMCFQYLRAEEV